MKDKYLERTIALWLTFGIVLILILLINVL
jgi:hypothetical protein